MGLVISHGSGSTVSALAGAAMGVGPPSFFNSGLLVIDCSQAQFDEMLEVRRQADPIPSLHIRLCATGNDSRKRFVAQ